MKFLQYFAIGIGAGLIQGALEIAWSLGISPPDVLLLLVLWLGMSRQTSAAMIVAFVGGIVLDSVAPSQAVGVQSLCKVVVAYLPEWAHYILLPETRITGFLLVAVGTLIQQFFLLTIAQTMKPGGVWGSRAFLEMAGLLFINLSVWAIITLWLSPSPQEKGAI